MIRYLNERTLVKLISKANELELTKERIIQILPPNTYGDYTLIYGE